MTTTIVSPSPSAVKPRCHARIVRRDIPVTEIAPSLSAFGVYVAECWQKGCGVRIPAMTNQSFGQVLRTLEINRNFN